MWAFENAFRFASFKNMCLAKTYESRLVYTLNVDYDGYLYLLLP